MRICRARHASTSTGPTTRPPSLDGVEILLWLVPAAVATVLAMCWAGWAGRPRPEGRDRSEAAYERFARAMEREHPGAGRPSPVAPRDRSTGIAVRPSRRQEPGQASRRSA
jgi:hypothetical protein